MVLIKDLHVCAQEWKLYVQLYFASFLAMIKDQEDTLILFTY